MTIPKGYELTKDKWHYFDDCEAVYVDERGYITKVMKRDHNGQWVSAAVYASCGNGALENIMPCTRDELRRKGVIC